MLPVSSLGRRPVNVCGYRLAWPRKQFLWSLLSRISFNVTTGHDENRDGLANDRPASETRNTGKGPGAAVIDLRWFRELRLKPSAKDIKPAGDTLGGCV